MRYLVLALCLSFGAVTDAAAQVDVSIGVPGVSISFDVDTYPDLVAVPGYPVYYAPQLTGNYFFYDGMFWALDGDNWYSSTWYNGPWETMTPEAVPLFVLRVPVSYYRAPPPFFAGWAPGAPPRWGDHWGPSWQQGHANWDQWNHGQVPAPAPLPTYQRQYSGSRYPQAAEQHQLVAKNYHYQPKDPVVRQQFQKQVAARPTPAQTAPKGMQKPVQRPAAEPKAAVAPRATSEAEQHAAPAEARPAPRENAPVRPTTTPTEHAQPREAPAPRPAAPAEAKPRAEPAAAARPEVRPEARPEPKAEVKPEVKPEAKPEVKSEARPAAPAHAEPEKAPAKEEEHKD